MSNAAPSGAGADRRRTDRGQFEDDIAQELLAVRELIESTVVRHRVRQAHSAWVTPLSTDDEEMVATGGQLVAGARKTVDVVYAVCAPSHSQVLRTILAGWLTTGERQVRTRVLFTPATLDRQLIREYAEAGRPLEARVAQGPLLSAMMVDEDQALVCADTPSGSQASWIRDMGVMVTLKVLFDGIWRSAAVATEQLDFGDRARTTTVRQILEWLRLGVTDEVAARELSVSVRTYRRCVAEIMILLGANSRFQAGARAAELGLLPISLEPNSRPRR